MAMKKKFYKAFNATFDSEMKLVGLDCRQMEFKIGKKTTNKSRYVKLCNSGIHFCDSIEKVNSYYTIARNNQVIGEIVPSGKMDHSSDKSCSRSITIKKLLPYWKAYLKTRKFQGYDVTKSTSKKKGVLWIVQYGLEWKFNLETDRRLTTDAFFSCKNDVSLFRNSPRHSEVFDPKYSATWTKPSEIIKIPVECTIVKVKSPSTLVTRSFYIIENFKTIEDIVKEFKRLETLQNKTKKK